MGSLSSPPSWWLNSARGLGSVGYRRCRWTIMMVSMPAGSNVAGWEASDHFCFSWTFSINNWSCFLAGSMCMLMVTPMIVGIFILGTWFGLTKQFAVDSVEHGDCLPRLLTNRPTDRGTMITKPNWPRLALTNREQTSVPTIRVGLVDTQLPLINTLSAVKANIDQARPSCGDIAAPSHHQSSLINGQSNVISLLWPLMHAHANVYNVFWCAYWFAYDRTKATLSKDVTLDIRLLCNNQNNWTSHRQSLLRTSSIQTFVRWCEAWF